MTIAIQNQWGMITGWERMLNDCRTNVGRYGRCMATLWSKYGQSMVIVWSQFGHSWVTVWSHYGHSMVTVWSRYGHGVVTKLKELLYIF